MRLRDILILAGLILLILGLTIAEKYAQRQREDQRAAEAARVASQRQEQIMTAFEERWHDLSEGVRATLDSLAKATMATGVSSESLATVVVETPPETIWVDRPVVDSVVVIDEKKPEEAKEEVAETEPAKPAVDSEKQLDSLALVIAKDYRAALKALPEDLNAYELRVATNEVASVLRAKYNLTTTKFDAMLKRAVKLEDQAG